MLRRHRPPVGVAHVLDDVLHHLAALLVGDQGLVGHLLGPDVTNAEIQHVPAQLNLRALHPPFLGDRGLGRIDVTEYGRAGRGDIVVARIEPGGRRQLR